MSAVLDKDIPFMFSMETKESKPELDTIVTAKEPVDISEELAEELIQLHALMDKLMAKIYKKLEVTQDKKFRIKILAVIVLLTEIFSEHLLTNTNPSESMDYILDIMDSIWIGLQQQNK